MSIRGHHVVLLIQLLQLRSGDAEFLRPVFKLVRIYPATRR